MKTAWLIGLLAGVLMICIGIAKGLVALERAQHLESFPSHIAECRTLCADAGWSYSERNGCACAGT